MPLDVVIVRYVWQLLSAIADSPTVRNYNPCNESLIKGQLFKILPGKLSLSSSTSRISLKDSRPVPDVRHIIF